MSIYPAAWHPLPDDATTLRYFDGQQWTQYFRHWDGYQWVDGQRPVAPVVAAQPTQQVEPAQYAQPVQDAHHDQYAQSMHYQQPAATYGHYPNDFSAQPQRRRRSHKMWIIPVAAVSVLFMAAGGVYFGMFYGSDQETVEEAASSEGRASSGNIEPIVNGTITNALTSEVVYTDSARGLDYTLPIVDIEARDGVVEIPLAVDSLRPADRPAWAADHARADDDDDSARWAVGLFADPDLKTEVGMATSLDDGTLSITPLEVPLSDRLDEYGDRVLDPEFRLREGGFTGDFDWGMRETYYVVRYVSDDGEMSRLERPVVAKLSFTQSLATPVVQIAQSTATPGSIELRWKETPGAASYGVFVSHAGADSLDRTRTQVLLGETTETSWVPDEDGAYLESIYQNYAMNTGVHEADGDYYSMGTEYGVIAYDSSGEQMSGLGSVSANHATVEALPYMVDFDLIREWQQELPCMAADDCTFHDNMTFAPYISVGGDVRKGLVNATDLKWVEEWNSYGARMEIEGTTLWYHQSVITTDESEAHELVEAFNERAALERLETGGVDVSRETDIDDSAEATSTVDPTVLDQVVTMDHELVGYIATHLYEGHTAVDMSGYAAFWNPADIDRATGVAYYQNPQFGLWAWGYDDYSEILYLEYHERDRAMEARARITEIVDGMGLESMTDTQKVEVINQYVVDHIEYDYDALDAATSQRSVSDEWFEDHWKAWSLEGAVFDGVVVCVGYSYMFQAMAIDAGLEAVFVAGTVDGSALGHAWNKVKVDGEWKIVDTTWNDGSGNAYLMLNDDGLPYGETRHEDPDWLMGDTAQYATP